MRIGVAQINTTLGDFSGNAEKVAEYMERASQRFCDLVVFPESTIFGYHPFDLLERDELVDQQLAELRSIQKKIPKGMAVILGVITKNSKKKGRPYYNSAALLQFGKKPQFFHKQLLPTGDVFDEARFIESGKMEKNFFTLKGKKIFLTICEDIWAWPDTKGHSQYEINPLEKISGKKVDVVINISASPYYPGKVKTRKILVEKTAKKMKAPMIYCNLVGAQDEIIFDGGSFAMDKGGKIILQNLQFVEDFNVLELEKMQAGLHPQLSGVIEELHQGIVLGIRDFCEKTGMTSVHFGLSGGIDSALVACLAVDALGPKYVKAFYLPSEFNAPESRDLAHSLAKNLQIEIKEIAIQPVYAELKQHLDRSFGITEFSVFHENLQSRLRGTILMSYANLMGSLLLTTGNKSELAVGYTTLYGDLCGGLAPIGDLTKQQIVEMAQYYNRDHELIPKRIITRPPSAELHPNQEDQDTLPPYPELDAAVVNLVERAGKTKTKTEKWLLQKLLKSEFKRWQAPPILKVSRHSFGRGRRWPVAMKLKV